MAHVHVGYSGPVYPILHACHGWLSNWVMKYANEMVSSRLMNTLYARNCRRPQAEPHALAIIIQVQKWIQGVLRARKNPPFAY